MSQTSARVQTAPRTTSRPRIMICDDDPSIASALDKGLSQAGFQVEAFTDSRDALERYVPGSYRLIILDEMMPNIDGIVLYKLIKEKDPDVKACFLTGYNSAVKRALPNFDPIYLLEKPVSIADLVSFLNSVIGTK